ncbi:MAG: ABC transporter substrate-binding protein [Solirubrobacterales bacterium]|nr:ABC transporter substrate-binding protein [Solirubrobacterales bacterium]
MTRTLIGLIAGCFFLSLACAPAAPQAAPAATSAPAAGNGAAQVTSGPTAASAAAPSGGTIKLAGVGPMSGSNAQFGTDLKAGMQLAMDEINAAGGIGGKQVVADFYDDEGKPESAASVAQKIAGDPDVFAVVGHVNSSCTLAALPIYSRAGLTEISGDSSNPTITHQGYKTFFRTLVNDALAGPSTVTYAVNTLGKKKLGIIYENTDYGKGLMDASQPVIQQLGAQVVDAETYTMGTDKDFSAQLTKIKAAQPDVLIHYGNYGEGGPIMAQAAKIGLNVPKLVEGGDQDQQFIELAGKDAVEGVNVFSTWDPNSQIPAAKGFQDKYKAKTGQDSTEWSAYNYDIVYLLKMAIEQGATRETLPDVLHTIKQDGVTGHTEFDANGDVTGKQLFVLTIKDGKFVTSQS